MAGRWFVGSAIFYPVDSFLPFSLHEAFLGNGFSRFILEAHQDTGTAGIDGLFGNGRAIDGIREHPRHTPKAPEILTVFPLSANNPYDNQTNL